MTLRRSVSVRMVHDHLADWWQRFDGAVRFGPDRGGELTCGPGGEMTDTIRTISRDELQARLDAGEDVKLVMTLHEWAYRAARIPGSLHFATVDEAYAALDPEDEIVVYCSDPACVASQYAYRALVDRGYMNVRRYAGGLSDWNAAGLPLDSDHADPSHSAST